MNENQSQSSKPRTRFVFATIFATLVLSAHIPAAEPFHPKDVKLLDGPFERSLDLNESYLFAHDPDRFLAPFLTEAGLEAKAEKYGNWESSGLDGHSGGHYLSALAFSYASTGKQEYIKRLEYMLDELERCQAQSDTGYVGGVPGGNLAWERVANGEIDAQRFSLNGAWVPWYNLHKLFAGLKDAWLVAESEKAGQILIKLSDWCVDLFKDIEDSDMQKMLYAEHGGMNDVFAEIYQVTGDVRYLAFAKRFSHNELLDSMIEGDDTLTGMHANTQIPKAIGFQRIAMNSKDAAFGKAARFFWDTVVENRSIVFGGNSVREHFNESDDFQPMLVSREGPESCNTYNMLRLSNLLYLDSTDSKYIDYYERALFNHILSLQHPETGGFVYFTPIRPRHYRVYSQAETAFWCCVGSGMENPGRYSEIIYAHDQETLFVNLFISSTLSWKSKGVVLTQTTDFPREDSMRFEIETENPTRFSLALRKPSWADQGVVVIINGEQQSTSVKSGYIRLDREWASGDTIELTVPMSLHVEQLPDQSNYYAFLYGPIALAAKHESGKLEGLFAGDGRMEHIAPGAYLPLDQAHTLIGQVDSLLSRATAIPKNPLHFELAGKISPTPTEPIVLEPFAQIHESRYTLYWRATSEAEYESINAELQLAETNAAKLVARTIDSIFPGEQQSEVEHDFSSQNSETGTMLGKQFRKSSHSFEYTLRSSEAESEIAITYFGSEWGRACDIQVNGITVGEIIGAGQSPEQFIDATFALPAEVEPKAQGRITVTIVAKNEQITPSIFAIHHRVKVGQ